MPKTLCNLPSELDESSGIYAPFPDLIWSHNDSGGEAKLLIIDTLGNLANHSLTIMDTQNVDWEDITFDALKGKCYIGDFGNNLSKRKDLKVLSIPRPEILSTIATNPIDVIEFSYEDQTDFNPPLGTWRFDAEALFAEGDSLYIFTKPYTLPFSAETRIYRIPTVGGKHLAQYVGRFATDLAYDKGQITSVAMNTAKTKAVFLANNAIYMFSNFVQAKRFWEGNLQKYYLSPALQREAVTFVDDCTVYISSEKGSQTHATLAKLNVCNLTSTSTAEIKSSVPLNIYPNPSTAGFFIDYQFVSQNAKLNIVNLLGQVVFEKTLTEVTDFPKIYIPAILPKGIFQVQIEDDKNVFLGTIIIE
jgi:hypothetical protein